jgi:hypothetical protein
MGWIPTLGKIAPEIRGSGKCAEAGWAAISANIASVGRFIRRKLADVAATFGRQAIGDCRWRLLNAL